MPWHENAEWTRLRTPRKVALVACGGRDQSGAFARTFAILATDAPAASAKISTGEISKTAGARQVAERGRPLLSVARLHPDEGLRY